MLVWPKSSSNKISCFVILQSTLGPLLQNSKTVAFHFAPNDQESLKALYRVMASHGIKFVSVCALPVQCSTNWAYKPTGSWSLCCFVINPWSDESMTVKIWKSFMWTAVGMRQHKFTLVRLISSSVNRGRIDCLCAFRTNWSFSVHSSYLYLKWIPPTTSTHEDSSLSERRTYFH